MCFNGFLSVRLMDLLEWEMPRVNLAVPRMFSAPVIALKRGLLSDKQDLLILLYSMQLPVDFNSRPSTCTTLLISWFYSISFSKLMVLVSEPKYLFFCSDRRLLSSSLIWLIW